MSFQEGVTLTKARGEAMQVVAHIHDLWFLYTLYGIGWGGSKRVQ